MKTIRKAERFRPNDGAVVGGILLVVAAGFGQFH